MAKERRSVINAAASHGYPRTQAGARQFVVDTVNRVLAEHPLYELDAAVIAPLIGVSTGNFSTHWRHQLRISKVKPIEDPTSIRHRQRTKGVKKSLANISTEPTNDPT